MMDGVVVSAAGSLRLAVPFLLQSCRVVLCGGAASYRTRRVLAVCAKPSASARPRRRACGEGSAVIAGLLLFAAVAAQAEEMPETQLEEQRVTASALPITPAATSQHVTILRRADLDALRGESLPTVLARQAGLVVDRGPRSGGYGALYLRGADPSHVVVLVDHVRQNDPLSSRGSAVDLNTLSVDDIERIEIVRGNASVANAEAIAGLIHIFTRRAEQGAAAGAGLGGDGLRSAHAGWAGQGPRLGAAYREEGDAGGGLSRTRALNAGWDARLGAAFALQADARLADSRNRAFPDDSGGPRYAVRRVLDTRESESRQLSLRGEYTARAGVLELQAATLSRDGDERTPGVAPGLRDPQGLPPITTQGNYRRNEALAAWRVGRGDGLLMTAGAQYQRESGHLDSLIDFGVMQLAVPFSLRRETAALFAEARWQAGPWALQGGLRHERYGGAAAADASATHPLLSLQHSLAAGRGSWGASLARASKLPSFYALGQPLVGNPQLKPETAQQRELYYATAGTAVWSGRVSLFSARYRDLVDFDAGPPPRLVNRDRIEAEGLEWRGSRRFANDWQLQLDGCWLQVRNPDGGAPLRYRPKIQAGAQLGMPLGPQRELSLRLQHLGRRFDSTIPSGDGWLAATTNLDLALRQQFGATQLLLALENLGNTRRDETLGTPQPGRRLRLMLDWRLP